MRTFSTLAILAAVWAGVTPLEEPGQPVPTDRKTTTDPREGAIVFRQIPIGDASRRDSGLPSGSRLVLLEPMGTWNAVRTLTDGFAAVGRPDLSFDGRRVLFAGRRTPAGPAAVWEMQLDGTNVRRIVTCEGACDQAIYLSTMFDLGAKQPVYRIAFRGVAIGESGHGIYTCRMDGGLVRRITFSPQDVADPLALSDSRLVFGLLPPAAGKTPRTPGSRGEQTDRLQTGPTESDEMGRLQTGPTESDEMGRLQTGPTASGSTKAPHASGSRFAGLMAVNTDGTDLFPFTGVHDKAVAWTMPCETPDGWVVYVEADGTGAGADRGGSLAAVRRTSSLHTRRVIAADIDGRYRSPSPIPDGRLLVSFQKRGAGSYGVFVLDAETGRRLVKLYDDPAWDDVEAVWVGSRPEPSGRSSVVNPKSAVGQLYMLNAYLSDRPEAAKIAPGAINRLRVIQAAPRGPGPGSAGGGFHESETVLGEVPVESDGSVFLEVPAQTPLRVETLDQSGAVLQSMRSWLWVMPGERRGCIGCHEDRESTPPNRHVLALRKAAVRVGVAARPIQSAGAGGSNEEAPR